MRLDDIWYRCPAGLRRLLRGRSGHARARAIHRCAQFARLKDVVGWVTAARAVGAGVFGAARTELRLPGVRQPVRVRLQESDLDTLFCVFRDRDCDLDLEWAPKVIFDCGANVGYASIWFANRYPSALVVAIEPDPANYSELVHNVSRYDNIRTMNAAVWSHDCNLKIENPESESWARRVADSDDAVGVALRGRNIADLLADHGLDRIDILKLDIEGAELVVLGQHADRWAAWVGVILLETHGSDADAAARRFAESHGFRVSHGMGEKYLLRASTLCNERESP